MKLAVRTAGGEFILIGESMERIQQYIRVNPTAQMVKKSRGIWKVVE